MNEPILVPEIDVPEIDDAELEELNLNPAVMRCIEAYWQSRDASTAENRDGVDTEFRALVAYRDAMPHLFGHDGIADFIACTAYGMLKTWLDPDIGTKLLYAAQVAVGALRNETLALRNEARRAC